MEVISDWSMGRSCHCTIQTRSSRRLGRDGKIGFGESYMAGEWSSTDLVVVVEALARQADSLVPRPLQLLRRCFEAKQPIAEDNDRVGAARNIVRHYDLSNELFATFLDQSMTYSAGLFTDQHSTLAQAQIDKIERLLDATGVQRDTRLLEIGTGGVNWPSERLEGVPMSPL